VGAVYLSHPVRRMREEPAAESVSLRVEAADDADVDAVADDLDAVGTVEEHLRFGALRVTVDQRRLDDLVAVEGISSVETAATLGIESGDAGEDTAPGR